MHDSFEYTVEVSVDGADYRKIVSREKKRDEVNGERKIGDHRFGPARARFVRIKDNRHLLEVKVYRVPGSKPQEPPLDKRILQAAKEKLEVAGGKPVKSSGVEHPSRHAMRITDGRKGKDSAWWGTGDPRWIEVDLEEEYEIGEIWLQPWWDDGDNGRAYRYTVTVSADGRTWKQVVDESRNTTPHTAAGETHTFDPLPARYVRVTGISHLCEVKVYRAARVERR